MSTELRNTSDDGACFLCGPPPEEEQEKQNFSRRQVLTHGLFTGLADCQARAEAALDFQFNAALATLNLVRVEELRAQTDQSPHVFSMASWKQRHFNERLLDVFIAHLVLDPTWVKNHPGYEELRTYGAIAA